MTAGHKSDTLKWIALSNGWKAEVVTSMEEYEKSGNVRDILWHLYAIRDRETIHVMYVGNRLDGGSYKYGDYTMKLWWKNEVVKVLKGKPDPAKFRKKGEAVTVNDEVARSVPWDHDSPALEILVEVIRKEIKWVRKIDGQVCSAVVDVNLKEAGSAKHFRIYEGKNGRVLEWADALGFHAVALDQIINVS